MPVETNVWESTLDILLDHVPVLAPSRDLDSELIADYPVLVQYEDVAVPFH